MTTYSFASIERLSPAAVRGALECLYGNSDILTCGVSLLVP